MPTPNDEFEDCWNDLQVGEPEEVEPEPEERLQPFRIRLTAQGEHMVAAEVVDGYDNLTGEPRYTRLDAPLSVNSQEGGFGLLPGVYHDRCGAVFDRWDVGENLEALVCRRCHLRIVIEGGARTYAELGERIQATAPTNPPRLPQGPFVSRDVPLGSGEVYDEEVYDMMLAPDADQEEDEDEDGDVVCEACGEVLVDDDDDEEDRDGGYYCSDTCRRMQPIPGYGHGIELTPLGGLCTCCYCGEAYATLDQIRRIPGELYCCEEQEECRLRIAYRKPFTFWMLPQGLQALTSASQQSYASACTTIIQTLNTFEAYVADRSTTVVVSLRLAGCIEIKGVGDDFSVTCIIPTAPLRRIHNHHELLTPEGREAFMTRLSHRETP